MHPVSGPWSRSTNEFRVSPTITAEMMSKNKIPETPGCLCGRPRQRRHLDDECFHGIAVFDLAHLDGGVAAFLSVHAAACEAALGAFVLGEAVKKTRSGLAGTRNGALSGQS
jgi:hypothetical protein